MMPVSLFAKMEQDMSYRFDLAAKDSTGVVYAQFLNISKQRVIRGGQYVYEASFKLLLHSGISPSSIVNKNLFKIIVSAPFSTKLYKKKLLVSFQKDEKSLLLIKKSVDGHVLVDFENSKYFLKQSAVDQEFRYVYDSDNPEQQISYEKLQMILKARFGAPLALVQDERVAFLADPKILNRLPAAHLTSSDNEGPSAYSFLWPVIIMAILGALSQIIFRHK